jgi:uncharacterized protein
MNCLIDTNIFLEILLRQSAAEKCKQFLQEPNELFISDFSVHSVGVRLFRDNQPELFETFIADSLPNLEIISLSDANYGQIVSVRRSFGLDFDDAYQFAVATEHNCSIVTQDKDFIRVKNESAIIFL